MRKIKGYGWTPQLPDHRDFPFDPAAAVRRAIVELDVHSIPVLGQGQQGACVGHGVTGPVMYDQQQQGLPVVVPSREFIYYNARVYEGTQDQDSGAEVRDGVKVVANLGVPPDSDFPYNDQVFDVKPPQQAYDNAVKQEAIQYEFVRYGHLRDALATGFPFVYGFSVYPSFESDQVANTGLVPMPGPNENVIGGHCVWAWGYNDGVASPVIPKRYVANRNSWEESWGDGGNFYLPYEYYQAGLCSDFWLIRRIS